MENNFFQEFILRIFKNLVLEMGSERCTFLFSWWSVCFSQSLRNKNNYLLEFMFMILLLLLCGSWVSIRMVNHGSLPVGFFHLLIISSLTNPQDLVVVLTLRFTEFKLSILQQMSKQLLIQYTIMNRKMRVIQKHCTFQNFVHTNTRTYRVINIGWDFKDDLNLNI